MKTDLSQAASSKDIVHDRYKDLALVEWAFRESKTVHLEMRPVNVRLETRTRGHAFVVMLAYSIIRALATRFPLEHGTTIVRGNGDQPGAACRPGRPKVAQPRSGKGSAKALFWHNFAHASGGTLGDRRPKPFGAFLTLSGP